MQELRTTNNAVFRLVLHLVLVTKYRRPVLTSEMLTRAAEIMKDVAARWECALLECQGDADHLHALLEVLPRVRPSDLVNNLKTVTSRRLRKEFPFLVKAYKRPVLWSPSYCLISAGGAPIALLREYIQGQRSPT